MIPDTLITALVGIESTERFFNLYTEDKDDRGLHRQENLRRYLTQMKALSPDTLLLAEAPGYRGCRLTGIPVTSERIMLQKRDRWDLFGEGYIPTTKQPGGVSEMTATILWEAVDEYLEKPPLLWNTAPLHPHKPEKLESNLTPTYSELQTGIPLIEEVIRQFAPTRILAMGQKARMICGEMGLNVIGLRHPSHGGKYDFIDDLLGAYGIE